MSENLRSIRDALTVDSFPLKLVAKMDLQGLQSWLTCSIGYMLEYYGFSANENVEKSVTLNQIRMLSSDICEKYKDYTMADLIMCFKMARQNPGRYGKFYGRFDASVVMGWLEKYSEERDELLPTLPINNAPMHVPLHSDMDRDLYKAMLLSMSAAGDSEAYKHYLDAEELDSRLVQIYDKSARYRYDRLHRSDDNQKKGGRCRK